MLFNSFEFAVFFPLVAAAYFLLPYRWRWLLLLVASYYFYMAWKAQYAILLVISTVIDFVASNAMAKASDQATKKRWLLLSIFTNLGILVGFKYFNFLNASVRAVFPAWPVEDLDVLLPMGISFYTFQTMSYTIDVYRGLLPPTRHFGRFALYVTFFPQLVAGPIERAPNLLPQFFKDIPFDADRVIRGLKQMLWGFFKKLVIADRVGLIVDQVYNAPAQQDGLTVVLASVLFALQIYCDFSGYSDIAIGAARVLGYDLMENFRTPYGAASIREFWSRWHISLSTWFRDYVYIPLGGNRVVRWRWYYNLFVVFAVSGLWHGANWTFIVWGALHGAYLVLALVFAPFWERVEAGLGVARIPVLWRALNRSVTLLLVLVAWVLFRANDLGDVAILFGKVGEGVVSTSALEVIFRDMGAGIVSVSLLLAALFVLIDPWADDVAKGRRQMNGAASYAYHGLLLAACLLFGHFGSTAFIYFQF
ncbi:MAG: MBOAT family protein [Flavobacteriales bacterium]|nr:MBOAT family protein [Flavobacteriales bacterium]